MLLPYIGIVIIVLGYVFLLFARKTLRNAHWTRDYILAWISFALAAAFAVIGATCFFVYYVYFK